MLVKKVPLSSWSSRGRCLWGHGHRASILRCSLKRLFHTGHIYANYEWFKFRCNGKAMIMTFIIDLIQQFGWSCMIKHNNRNLVTLLRDSIICWTWDVRFSDVQISVWRKEEISIKLAQKVGFFFTPIKFTEKKAALTPTCASMSARTHATCAPYIILDKNHTCMSVLGASVVDPAHLRPPSVCKEMEVPIIINGAYMSNNLPNKIGNTIIYHYNYYHCYINRSQLNIFKKVVIIKNTKCVFFIVLVNEWYGIKFNSQKLDLKNI